MNCIIPVYLLLTVIVKHELIVENQVSMYEINYSKVHQTTKYNDK